MVAQAADMRSRAPPRPDYKYDSNFPFELQQHATMEKHVEVCAGALRACVRLRLPTVCPR